MPNRNDNFKTINLKNFDVIIIGAGPAGLFAAANIENLSTLLIDKNDVLGKKLLIAGSGKCNITHECKLSEFFKHYGNNHRFLKPALNNYTNQDLIDFFNSHGLKTMVDKNGKVFPASENAKDIVRVLTNVLLKNKTEVKFNSNVTEIKTSDDIFLIGTEHEKLSCKFLIISTGGLSYPSTGSTGDGLNFAKSLGHNIVKTKPALAPIFIKNFTFKELSGVSFTNRQISLYRNNKKINENLGDFGFTHKGLSGPGILDFSRYMENEDIIKINFTTLNAEELRNTFIADNSKDGKLNIKNYLKRFEIPESVIKHLLAECNIDFATQLATLSKEIRNKLIEILTNYPFLIDQIGGYNTAMATTGGVTLSEINPNTMESRIVKNLYFAGEVLDIDGDTGGYNIQAAFSTGFLAAKSITSKI